MSSTDNNATPSPPSKALSNALFNTFAAFTCLVFAIDLANAFVYLEANLSYKLSSIASSVIENARAIVSCVYLAVKVSCALSNVTA